MRKQIKITSQREQIPNVLVFERLVCWLITLLLGAIVGGNYSPKKLIIHFYYNCIEYKIFFLQKNESNIFSDSVRMNAPLLFQCLDHGRSIKWT